MMNSSTYTFSFPIRLYQIAIYQVLTASKIYFERYILEVLWLSLTSTFAFKIP